MRRLIQLVIPCVFLSGCFGPGEGVEVPQDEIYFPTGLALDTPTPLENDQVSKSRHLFVVSSDFDLQYNGGAVQSYDLDELTQQELPRRCNVDADCPTTDFRDGEELRFQAPFCNTDIGMCVPERDSVPEPCPQGDRPDADRLLFPGRCNPIDPKTKRLQTAKVKIGAFATDAILRKSGNTERLFVPVRGDSTLHWLNVIHGELDCGQQGTGACNAAHRAGDDPSLNVRGLKLNAEPFAIDATEQGDQIVVTNQTTGTASLFIEGMGGQGPKLAFALSDRLPQRPVGVVALPSEGNDYETFMMTFRDSAQVRLFRFTPDGGDARPYLVDGGGVAIDANSVGTDSRGIAVDHTARDNAKKRCAGDTACESEAALVPLDVYVANRAPSTLLIGRTSPPQEYPYFFNTVALTAGPSRVVVAHVQTASGDEARVFVACFDSRRVFIYDPQRSRIETEILTGRGPHALAVDKERKLLYVGHFTDSYVGVYSLDLGSPATYGTMLGTLGTPKSPRSSK